MCHDLGASGQRASGMSGGEVSIRPSIPLLGLPGKTLAVSKKDFFFFLVTKDKVR